MRSKVSTRAETTDLIYRAIDMMLTKVGLEKAPYRLHLEIPWEAVMRKSNRKIDDIVFHVNIEATWDEPTE